ncbi:MAG: hypothetical protein BEN19_03495 [Epulopiscium sp. Nuni2H_MBin003]|nr:MAG: hypothetical protein BEN19_03495 [Epulopiscium sp. Nuni2H_MBin003]
MKVVRWKLVIIIILSFLAGILTYKYIVPVVHITRASLNTAKVLQKRIPTIPIENVKIEIVMDNFHEAEIKIIDFLMSHVGSTITLQTFEDKLLMEVATYIFDDKLDYIFGVYRDNEIVAVNKNDTFAISEIKFTASDEARYEITKQVAKILIRNIKVEQARTDDSKVYSFNISKDAVNEALNTALDMTLDLDEFHQYMVMLYEFTEGHISYDELNAEVEDLRSQGKKAITDLQLDLDISIIVNKYIEQVTIPLDFVYQGTYYRFDINLAFDDEIVYMNIDALLDEKNYKLVVNWYEDKIMAYLAEGMTDKGYLEVGLNNGNLNLSAIIQDLLELELNGTISEDKIEILGANFTVKDLLNVIFDITATITSSEDFYIN